MRSGEAPVIDVNVLALEGAKSTMAIAGVFSFMRALAVVGQAAGLGLAIVGVWEGCALTEVMGWIALFFACFVTRQVVYAVQDGVLDRYAHARASELRGRLLDAVFKLGPLLVQRRGSASVSAAVIEGIGNVEAYIALIIPKMISVVVVPFVILVAMFCLDWVSGLIAAVCFPFIILYMIMIGHTAQDDAARRLGAFERMSNHFVDSLRGMDTLKAFGQGKAHEKRIFDVSEKFRAATMKTLRVATLSSAVLDTFATLALAAVAIMLGFRLVDGSLAFLPALMVLIMVPEYFRPIREFASDYHASLDGKTSLASIRGIIAEADALACADADLAIAPGRPANPRCAFRHVGFAYDDHEALRDVAFEVAGPCKVGVVGASGSGKSTLLSVLGGFGDPSSGLVEVDGARASTLRMRSWQRRVSLIPQDPYIFHTTLRDNVAFYRPDAADDEVRAALAAVGLDQVLSKLPDGLDTRIGQGARALSGGQAQRIALARAFLDDTRDVLLFDEPTAHLDIETELELKESMLKLMEGRLSFIATHRLHWVRDMDYVLVIDDGRIVWQGVPDDLEGSAAWVELAAKGGFR